MTSTHLCVFFDDGDLEPVCACGARALPVTGDDGETVLLRVQPLAAAAAVRPAPDDRQHLAVPA